jgi:hypothetical protein
VSLISEQYIDFDRMVDDAAFVDAQVRAAEVEDRILAGEDGFTIGNVRYTVPSWRREPIKRLRVEWARWTDRRG